jgi:hypothetical protein
LKEFEIANPNNINLLPKSKTQGRKPQKHKEENLKKTRLRCLFNIYEIDLSMVICGQMAKSHGMCISQYDCFHFDTKNNVQLVFYAIHVHVPCKNLVPR